MENWQLILDPPGDPAANMAADEALAQRIELGHPQPILRIYRWNQPAISLGRRQTLDDLPQGLLQAGLAVVQRPTGGGIVRHHLDELTYAWAMPRALLPTGIPLRDLPRILHGHLLELLLQHNQLNPADLSLAPSVSAAAPIQLCFQSPVCGDLLFRGQKVAGVALRLWKRTVLFQGTIQGLPVVYNELEKTLCILPQRLSAPLRTKSQPISPAKQCC